jgi:Heterokaryon incompatibility protein (HET)
MPARICENCRNIDFAKVLSLGDAGPHDGEKWKPNYYLSYRFPATARCPCCKFIGYYIGIRSSSKEGVTEFCAHTILSGDRKDEDGPSTSSSVIIGSIDNRSSANTVNTHLVQFVLPCYSNNNGDPSRLSGRKMGKYFDWAVAFEWLVNCQNGHRKCSEWQQSEDHSSSIQGLVVMDCQDGTLVRLPKYAPYIALSYVWGDPKNADHFVRRGNRHPRTVQDAITATRSLNMRYLWVDRYCVPQSGPEKHRLIRAMADIYSGALLTLINARGSDSDDRFPGIGRERDALPFMKLGGCTFSRASTDASEVTNSCWNDRGWTYQEWLMSRRCLIFTSRQVFWKCWDAVCCESIRLPSAWIPGSPYGFSPTHLLCSFHLSPPHQISV